MDKEISEHIFLNRFGIAPLQTDPELKSYKRLPELISSLSNEVANSKGGSFLITGYRGVGKTSFVNKVLFEVESCIPCKNTKIVIIRLNLARGYTTDKLLRRMIRELFYALDRKGIFNQLEKSLQRKLNLSFLRTSHQIKTAFSESLKLVMTKTKGKRKSIELASKIGVQALTDSLASLSGKHTTSSYNQETQTNEKNNERGIELEFLEYDDEIAENDLSDLIDSLSKTLFQLEETAQAKQEWKQPEIFWQRVPEKVTFFKKQITFQRYKKPKMELICHNIKIVYILDEIDKITIEQAEEIFRSLKNIFLKGNITFIMVAGKEFYNTWLRKRSSEDDLFFSLFTRIVHIPLFIENDFSELANDLIENESNPIPENLLTHIKFRAKGTPREFLRELFQFVEWNENKPFINISNLNKESLSLSGQLYPLLNQCYEQVINNKKIQIDQGVLDHIRRCLHNWLDEMMYQVSFTKESILLPYSNNASQTEILFPPLTYSTLDDLFNRLLKENFIEKIPQFETSEDLEIFQFTSHFQKNLQAIESTVSENLRSDNERKERNARKITAEVNANLATGNYKEATQILKTAEAMDLSKEQKKDLNRSVNEYNEIMNVLTYSNEEYNNGNYLLAFDSLNDISMLGVNGLDIEAELYLKKLEIAIVLGKQLLKTGEFDSNYFHKLNESIIRSEKFKDRKFVQLRREAKDLITLKIKIEDSSNFLKSNFENGDPQELRRTYKELSNYSPDSQIVRDFQGDIQQIEHTIKTLETAEKILNSGEIESLNTILNELSNQKNKILENQVSVVFEQYLKLKKLFDELEYNFETKNNIFQVEEILQAIEYVNPKLTYSKKVSFYRESLFSWKKSKDLINKIDEIVLKNENISIDSPSYDHNTTWFLLGDLKDLLGNENREYQTTFQKLKRITLDKAQMVAKEIIDMRKDPEASMFSDPTMMVTKVARILDQLLKIDPKNLEANLILDTLKSKLNIKK